MSSKDSKPRGGSCCAMANCVQYSGKTKKDGTNVSFHRFPKDLERRKTWIHRCKRGDKWTPQSSYICSLHFSPDAFERNLKAELLGYVPKTRKLKPDAVPTLNLPANSVHKNEKSTSTINRQNRMNAKLAKQVHDELITSCLSSTSILPHATESTDENINCNQTIPSSTTDYEKLYNDLLKENSILQTENKKHKQELLLLKQITADYVKINERLRINMNITQKKLNTRSKLLKETEKIFSKTNILNKTKIAESEARKLVSTVFTPNQLNLIVKKKKKVHWTKDEIAKAITLMNYSKNAYMFVKNDLHYPLPGLSSIQRFTKTSSNKPRVQQTSTEIQLDSMDCDQ